MSQVPPPPPPAIIQPSPENSASLLGSPISIGHNNPPKIQNQPISQLIFRTRNSHQRKLAFKIAQSPNIDRPSEIRFIEIISDRQEYDEKNQIIIATGNVEMRYLRSLLKADRLEVNLPQRLAVGTGNVVLERGDQIFRGEKTEYSFFLNQGIIYNASGVIYQPTLDRDTNINSPENNAQIADRPLSDRLQKRQPLRRISTAEGYRFVIGGGDDLGLVDSGAVSSSAGGNINRLRFEADRVDFDEGGWTAENVRVTNDPFSPPELEIRADDATYTQLDPLVSELVTTNSRIVFDRTISVPFFRNRFIIDRNARQPGIIGFGYDSEDRGGLFVERGFNVLNTNAIDFEVIPQFFVERSIFGGGGLFNNNNLPPANNQEDDRGFLANFGFKTKLAGNFSPRTSINATTELTTLDFGRPDNNCNELPTPEAREACQRQAAIDLSNRCRIEQDVCPIEEQFRADVALQHKIGPLQKPHTLRVEYNYRDRLFNGSLGFQTVQSSLGALAFSPGYQLGNSKIFLNYQGSIQNIVADTDRPEIRNDFGRANLTRYQGAASLFRGFRLWQGKALDPTPDKGMRYTPKPIQPFWQFNTSVTGVSSLYSNGEDQSSIQGNLGTSIQLGHLSRNFFDYSAFNLNYSLGFLSNESPFLFDRFADTQTLSFGVSQQLYGPLIFTLQRSINLETGRDTTTDFFLEYSRRTYKVILRYTSVRQADNSTQGLGTLTLQISDFNWIGDPEPFDGTVTPVNQGVEQ